MPKILTTRSFFDPEFSARCALFGPGIESARTKHLVHRIVNARDDLFEAVEFVSGLPGKYPDEFSALVGKGPSTETRAQRS